MKTIISTFTDQLVSGNLSIEFIESTLSTMELAIKNNERELTVVAWNYTKLLQFTIDNFDTTLESILDYYIKCEEYELCDSVLDIKNKIRK